MCGVSSEIMKSSEKKIMNITQCHRTVCMYAEYVSCLSLSGLTVEWTENNQKKRIINVPHDVYELGCIQDVEDGLKVSMSSNRQFVIPNECLACAFIYSAYLYVYWKVVGFFFPPFLGCREGWLPSNGKGLRGRWRKRHP